MNPLYHQAKFTLSAPDLKSTPADTGREVAFAGRSNAGKSSALNTLSRQKSLARTSKTPGRTQLLNFFNLNEQQRFVDLPGYGYAKVPERVKRQWHILMETYLSERQSLYGIILVMDIRHPLTEFDWDWPKKCEKHIIMQWMQLDFLKEAINPILCGPNGVGKTMIAQNIAHQSVFVNCLL